MATRAGRADGLSTAYADVMVQGLAVGHTVVIKDETGHDLVLKNLGSTAIKVKLEALVPTGKQLAPNVEPIPNLAWISFHPSELEIAGGGQGVSTVRLNVPSNRSYKGKFYEVMIWSHSVPLKRGGVALGAGLESRVRFTTKK